MKVLRKIAEKLSRGKVLKRTISVGSSSVPLFVTPDAQLKYLKFGKEAFDSDLIKIAEKFLNPESKVWDIGANVGVFTFAAASVARKGQILSIEADVWLASILRRTNQLQEYKGKDIRVIPVAVSNKVGIANFQIAERGRASNALKEAGGRSQMGGVRETQFVPTLTLDVLAEATFMPDFIKIDVEGAELMVLQGALNVISKIRPLFYIEVGSQVVQDVLKIFTERDYLPYSLDGELLKEKLSPNTFFIPKENLDAVNKLRL